ncbi:HAD-IA family hydrolase [Falsirhodobacter halotolerans]|uniref:HAD-IA family hydrolase n=1 Tax=Falsirhodobacter halotolerans TaxID=1146892 RepID=UPI001FD2EC3D|nr:HAD-IA family hydrolase [Falsirhodobacter halotolerans]MCJ8138763.1 HAD-IA family hydrolase [Falsirhodobacter halotolerans]
MNIVFDIGNVLIRWDAALAFPDHDAEAFLARIDFPALNLRGDGGESFADLAQEIADPDDRALFLTYLANYARTIAQPIEGTWALMDRLRARGHAIHAITNWSAETWPTGVATHPRLATSFATTIVSGEEGVVKPAPAIFAALCARAGVAPDTCVFIDDSAANAAGARAFGMDAIHFTTPEALEAALIERGLL